MILNLIYAEHTTHAGQDRVHRLTACIDSHEMLSDHERWQYQSWHRRDSAFSARQRRKGNSACSRAALAGFSSIIKFAMRQRNVATTIGGKKNTLDLQITSDPRKSVAGGG
jgi:hypothetical protein